MCACADFIYTQYLVSGQSGCGGYRDMLFQASISYTLVKVRHMYCTIVGTIHA